MIFVDTSFWVALFNRRDARHAEARDLLARFDAEPKVTSNLVRGETWTFLRRREGHRFALAAIDGIDRSPRSTVAFVGEKIESDAWRWLRRHVEREYSFIDATSFAFMRANRIREALAFDGDFTAAGFVELRA